jgi:hypothetical protein
VPSVLEKQERKNKDAKNEKVLLGSFGLSE